MWSIPLHKKKKPKTKKFAMTLDSIHINIRFSKAMYFFIFYVFQYYLQNWYIFLLQSYDEFKAMTHCAFPRYLYWF